MGHEEEGGEEVSVTLLASERISSLWPVGTGTAAAWSQEEAKAGCRGADLESSSGFWATHKTSHDIGCQRGCHGN